MVSIGYLSHPMNRTYLKRLACDAFLVLSIFVFPWWTSLILGTVFLFLFFRFYEFLPVLAALSLLYAHGERETLIGALVLAILIFLGVEFLKKRLLFYDR